MKKNKGFFKKGSGRIIDTYNVSFSVNSSPVKWQTSEVDRLRVDWPMYRAGRIDPEQMRAMYKGRSIDSIGKKFHKVFGRLIKMQKNNPKGFEQGPLFDDGGIF